MRGLSILCALILGVPATGRTQSPPQKPKADSVARADSAARADSIALVRVLEKDLAQQTPDSGGAKPAGPRTGAGYMDIGFVALTDAGWSTEPDVTSLQRGDHDPRVRGFSIPNTELTLGGAVDPYFKGAASIIFRIDENGETAVELEEVFALTTSLPANLQLKAGQFFSEFGRQNPLHPHSWAFVDQPLVLNRMFGPEGLRSQGVRVSWLIPTPFYTEAMLTVANSKGGTTSSFRSDDSPGIHGGGITDRRVNNLGDMLIIPRIAASLDISETQTLLVGASAAFGPNNSGASARTRVLGVDGYWKWKPAAARAGFPFLSMQAEALVRSYDAVERTSIDAPQISLPNETLKDRGAYAQVLWGVKPRIVAGLRGELAKGDEAAFESELRANRVRVSPNFTWYPTEFSKLRVQYNFDDRRNIGTDHSLWFQFEFLLGAHASHKF